MRARQKEERTAAPWSSVVASRRQTRLLECLCRKWRMVAESPWLWRRMEVVVGQMKVTNMNILNTTRLRSVKRLRLLSRYHPDEQEAEAVFAAILEHEGIRELNISQNQISRVNPDTLARVVNNMEAVSAFFSF